MKIILCGSPHSGKSVFLSNLIAIGYLEKSLEYYYLSYSEKIKKTILLIIDTISKM